MSISSKLEWDEFLSGHPEAHLLQTSAWGELKANFGWQPVWVINDGCGAQILFRHLPLGYTIAYIPKGPVGGDYSALWPDVERVCRQRKAVFLKVEVDAWDDQTVDASLAEPRFRPAAPIQPRRTLVLSLEGSEDDWLQRFKQKTRYNIRLATKKEVVVRPSSDLGIFQNLMNATSERDAFGVHSQAYYQRAYDLFHPTGACELLIAEYAGTPLAGLMVFARGERAWYLYGASNDIERNRMPAYLLQWEAMRWAASRGCRSYDLWGVPDFDEDQLESEFTQRSDGLWGVYRFKRGFDGQLRRSCGAWDWVFHPKIYRLYQWYQRRRGGDTAHI